MVARTLTDFVLTQAGTFAGTAAARLLERFPALQRPAARAARTVLLALERRGHTGVGWALLVLDAMAEPWPPTARAQTSSGFVVREGVSFDRQLSPEERALVEAHFAERLGLSEPPKGA